MSSASSLLTPAPQIRWVSRRHCALYKLNLLTYLVTNTAASIITGYRWHCNMTFTGWMLLNGFSYEWLQLYTSVYGMSPAYLAELWVCVCPSLRQQVVVVGKGASWAFPGRTEWQTMSKRSVRTGQHDMTYSVKEDSASLDMWYEWITNAYLDRHCTGRFRPEASQCSVGV